MITRLQTPRPFREPLSFGIPRSAHGHAASPDGAATYYAWDGPRLLETRNADKTLKARFTHGRTQIEGIGSCVEIFRASDSKRFHCLFDHRGSAWKLLDENKSVA